jgi:hypothetical protein
MTHSEVEDPEGDADTEDTDYDRQVEQLSGVAP